ncbi:MAG: hypothetical protein QOG15_579 [Solirubrobacteraceae bacterium]|jgi:hypothetical protein|nr:hypothetical protein [Solirubrobacteraceae bacterium]
MPDLGSQVLEVAAGLIFVYLLFSLIASAMQELVSTIVGWRAQFLEQGLRQLLQGKTAAGKPMLDELLDHPRIKELISDSRVRKTRPLPSYISARTFSLTLLDTIAPPTAGEDSKDLVARVRAAVAGLPESDVKRKLGGILDVSGDDITKVRTEIEHWYDDAMNRVSGWYKRHSHRWLLLFGLIAVLAWNADTIQVVDRLWNDKTARAAVAAQADKAQQTQTPGDLNRLIDGYDSVQALQLPIGWTGGSSDDPRAFPGSINLLKVIGLLLTALAVSFGAPFWFDALSKLGRLRATGKPEGRAPGSANP